MPDMSGWEVAEAIRGSNLDIPIVLITGWDNEITEEMAAARGCHPRHGQAVHAAESVIRDRRTPGRLPGGLTRSSTPMNRTAPRHLLKWLAAPLGLVLLVGTAAFIWGQPKREVTTRSAAAYAAYMGRLAARAGGAVLRRDARLREGRGARLDLRHGLDPGWTS